MLNAARKCAGYVDLVDFATFKARSAWISSRAAPAPISFS
jgi:hypothetical protein